jgi:Fe2+ or Zn2+ uptake regulation protein
MAHHTDPLRLLQDSGLRATPQRRTVLSVIAAHGGHMTAEDVYREAKRLNPRISLATVYRTLTTLKEAGLIQHSYSDRDHDHSRFEPAGAPEHFHFTCLGCGKIIEFESRHISTLRRQLADDHGAQVTHACMCFTGYCRECRESASQRNGQREATDPTITRHVSRIT